jgi:hypothetical protein
MLLGQLVRTAIFTFETRETRHALSVPAMRDRCTARNRVLEKAIVAQIVMRFSVFLER